VAENVLEVKDLRTYFYLENGVLRAVDGLSYNVEKGQCVALVGESGCGKSVSALSIMRLIQSPPGLIEGGEIIFEGKDLLKMNDAEIRHIRGNRIGMVFQEPLTSFNPVLTIRFQLCESLQLHRGLSAAKASEEAINLLKLVGIPNPERRILDYPYQFSGGMLQRIMIAMALSCNPSLIIADEPTTSVDVTVQAQLLEVINNLRQQFSTAVIIITHNLGVVARYADTVQVMYGGRKIEGGTTEEIYNTPKHPYTIGLIASVPRLDQPRKKTLYTIDGSPPNLIELPRDMCSFADRCTYVIDRCRKERPAIEEVSPGHVVACFRSHEIEKLVEAV